MVHPHRLGFAVLSPWELVKRKGGRGTVFEGQVFRWFLQSWQERDPGVHLCWSPSTTLCRLFPHHWWCHQVQKRAQCHPLWRTEKFLKDISNDKLHNTAAEASDTNLLGSHIMLSHAEVFPVMSRVRRKNVF